MIQSSSDLAAAIAACFFVYSLTTYILLAVCLREIELNKEYVSPPWSRRQRITIFWCCVLWPVSWAPLALFAVWRLVRQLQIKEFFE